MKQITYLPSVPCKLYETFEKVIDNYDESTRWWEFVELALIPEIYLIKLISCNMKQITYLSSVPCKLYETYLKKLLTIMMSQQDGGIICRINGS